ncbi:SDR family oxidoreductase [Nesterenkonia haasae]|uniref:SDR family oxidoreductase n=1 Tax=Nesterenkonia haasae TaxID=2587813 RepID=UPI001390F975|nr:SDR family oxidoreductase [Nesterenkonia haasae]NDK31791.1 SDR family oxidoreductase [Nesterenkonia haasae]
MTEQHSAAEQKIILITGASSGIGSATATHLAAQGHTVILGARRTDRLAELVDIIEENGGTAKSTFLDVTNLENVTQCVNTIVAEYGRLDVLVNNAGIMPISPLAEAKVEEWNWMIDVNIRGVLHGIAAAQAVMLKQDRGHIITLASTGAHEVVPTGAVYCATKYAAWAISEGLRIESDPSLRVTTICPGVTESELADTISDPAARETMRTYRQSALPPTAIADAIAFAVNADAHVDVSEIIVRPTTQRP